jgi:hypothetical protein
MSVKNQNIDIFVKKGRKQLKKGQFEDALRIFDFAHIHFERCRIFDRCRIKNSITNIDG